MSLFQKKTRLIPLLIPLLLIIAFLSLTTGGARRAPWYEEILRNIITPPQRMFSSIGDAVSGVWSSYFALIGAEEENVILREHVAKLQSDLIRTDEVQKENGRLRDLLSYKETFPYQAIVAKVIANDPKAEFKSITINRGVEDGVKPLMPVIGPRGLVGKIGTVDSGSARVLLIIDPNSTTDVLVQRSRARGLVVGTAMRTELRPSYYLTRMEYLRRISDIKDGDVVVTSGFDRIFPAGIPIGTVNDLEKSRYGVFLDANVVPFENMDELQEVMVLLSGAKKTASKPSEE
ncbi:MAG: rod shape-determining protein MreC [Deltaproteobacteria bacterium]|nr:rod shape-determining protein MreC [Deltaproteobacteria bacterium]